jgi:uncharacterized protein (TIGR03437 family)
MFTPISSTQVGDKFGSPLSVSAADVNGDRLPDILLAATDGIHFLIAAGEGRFELSQLVVSGNFVRLLTADFNRDGFVDIAAGSNSGSTTILLGDGTGKFRKSAEFAGVGFGAADLNGDGIMDLALLSLQPAAISVSIGGGDGTFKPGWNFALTDRPSALVLADLNRDGKLDIVVGLRFSQNMTVLLGTGGENFRAMENPPACPYARDLAIADFNRDGIPDLVCDDGGIRVLAGKGDGSFTVQWQTDDQSLALAVAAGDFNGDGLPDIAVGHYYNAELSILLASTDGTFRLGARVPSVGDVAQIVTTDLNGDAKPDLVIASYSGSSVLAALGTGNGEFAPPACFGLGEMARLQVGDLNGDGAADFVVALPYRKTVVVIDGASGRRQLVNFANYPFDAAIIDVNADRTPDLVVATALQIAAAPGRESFQSSLELVVRPGRGDGSFGAPISTALGMTMTGAYYERPVVLAVGDFTGNGMIGAVVANNSAGALDVYRGNGAGTFTRVASLGTPPVWRMLAADLNGDGVQDIAVLGSGGAGNIYSGAAAGLNLLGSYPAICGRITGGVAGDFNGDRSLDLALACNDGRLKLLSNSGSGTFRDPATMMPGFQNGTIALSDFSGDGNADLIAVSLGVDGTAEGGLGRLMLGKGDGTFRASAVVKWPRLLDLLPMTPAGATRAGVVLLENTGNTRNSLSNQLQITLLRNTLPSILPGPLEVVSAASFKAGSVGQRSIIAIFGEGLSATTEAATSTALPAKLGATSVTLTDTSGRDWPVSLFFVSPGQINALVPPVPWGGSLPWSTSAITVISNDRTTGQGLVQVAPVAFSLFTANADGKGVPAAQVLRVKADGTRSTEPAYRCDQGGGSCVPLAIDLGPASDQVFLMLYGTGLGWCGPGSVKVLIASVTVPVQGAGPQGQYPGLDQINVLLPPSLAGRGESDLQLNACGYDANTVRVNIR